MVNILLLLETKYVEMLLLSIFNQLFGRMLRNMHLVKMQFWCFKVVICLVTTDICITTNASNNCLLHLCEYKYHDVMQIISIFVQNIMTEIE